MDGKQLSEYGEAVLNAKDINILVFSYEYAYRLMDNYLLNAFDNETTFDMRTLEQMELLPEKCSVGIKTEKDGKLYPYIKLAIVVRDGFYDQEEKMFKICKHRDAEFELKLTPFSCALDKLNQNTNGIYGRSDKEITIAWRLQLIKIFPQWEEEFRSYLNRIKQARMNDIAKQFQPQIEKLNRESEKAREKVEKEYQDGLASACIE